MLGNGWVDTGRRPSSGDGGLPFETDPDYKPRRSDARSNSRRMPAMPTDARPRRSMLYMPGSNPRALEKARTLPADALILDLEDSVAPDAKAQGRENIVKAL